MSVGEALLLDPRGAGVTLGAYLRNLRNARGLTQRDVVERLKLPPFCVSAGEKDIYEFEHGLRLPGQIIRAALTLALGANPLDIDKALFFGAELETHAVPETDLHARAHAFGYELALARARLDNERERLQALADTVPDELAEKVLAMLAALQEQPARLAEFLAYTDYMSQRLSGG